VWQESSKIRNVLRPEEILEIIATIQKRQSLDHVIQSVKTKLYQIISLHFVLYGYYILFHALNDEHRSMTFQNKMLSRIYENQ
jgi:hypothetical protein